MTIVISLDPKNIEDDRIESRKNKSAIMLDFLEHPLTSFQERYRVNKKREKNNTFTKNWNYARKYYLHLIYSGFLREFSFCNKAYVEPLPKELEKYSMILEKCEKIFFLIKKYPDIIENDCFQEFCKSQGLVNLSEFKKSRMKMSLMDYEYGIDLSQSFRKQMFSKFFKIFLVEVYNFQASVIKFKNKRKIFRFEKIDYRLDILYKIIRSFEKFLIKYDLPDSDLSEQFGFLAELLDVHYGGSEMCFYASGHPLGQEQKNSIVKQFKELSIGGLHRKYRRSRKHISNIVKGRS